MLQARLVAVISNIFIVDLLAVISNAEFNEFDLNAGAGFFNRAGGFFARARNFFRARRFFAGAGFFDRAGRFFNARAGFFDRARRFFNARARFFDRAGRFFSTGARDFRTARNFLPPPDLRSNVVDPELVLNIVVAIRVDSVALAFFHFEEACIIAVFSVVARTVHELNAVRNNDRFSTGARNRRFVGAGGFRFNNFARTGFRFDDFAGARFRLNDFTRARFRFNDFAGAGFRFFARARNFCDARSFNPPPFLGSNVVDPKLVFNIAVTIRVESIALAFSHFKEASIITILGIIAGSVDERNASRTFLSQSHCRGKAQEEGCYFGCFHLFDLLVCF